MGGTEYIQNSNIGNLCCECCCDVCFCDVCVVKGVQVILKMKSVKSMNPRKKSINLRKDLWNLFKNSVRAKQGSTFCSRPENEQALSKTRRSLEAEDSAGGTSAAGADS